MDKRYGYQEKDAYRGCCFQRQGSGKREQHQAGAASTIGGIEKVSGCQIGDSKTIDGEADDAEEIKLDGSICCGKGDKSRGAVVALPVFGRNSAFAYQKWVRKMLPTAATIRVAK